PHLSTPPVAPAWHRPDCPAGLEALMLRLLEKDPGRRPASAGAVREALAAISVRPEVLEGQMGVAQAASSPGPGSNGPDGGLRATTQANDPFGPSRASGRTDGRTTVQLANPLYR